MQAERLAQVMPERIWMVALWKYALDRGTAWYRVAFFRFIYRPFVHFAWKVMKIPAPKGMTIEGEKRTIFWFENCGFFATEDQADIACTSVWHGYKDVPFERRIEDRSLQYSSLVFPRQNNPSQSLKPTFSIIGKDRKQDEAERRTLTEYLAQLNQVLDR